MVSFKTRQGILKNLSMFRLKFDKFESIINLKMVNVFQDKTARLNRTMYISIHLWKEFFTSFCYFGFLIPMLKRSKL